MPFLAEEMAKAGLKYMGTPYDSMDCQEFVEACLKDIGLPVDKAGSNTWYRTMTWTGSPEECKKRFGRIPVGAFLFILEHDGKEPKQYLKDGIGNASHMGIKTNTESGAIHSSSTRGIVTESVFKDKTIPNGGWNRVGLWAVLLYGSDIDSQLIGTGNESVEVNAMKAAKVTAPSGSTVNMWKEAKRNSGLVDRIPIGTEVLVMQDKGEWMEILKGSKQGWMLSNYLEYLYQPDDTNSELGGAALEQVLNVHDNLLDLKADLMNVIDKVASLAGIAG